jgi:phenylacetate 2-hydroxylase
MASFAISDLVAPLPLIAVGLVVLVIGLVREAYRADIPKVKGLPEPAGALPFIGHLLPLGGREKRNDTVIFSRWQKELNADIFQVRLGSQRAVIVQGWQAIKDLWLGNSQALIDRPWQPGFIDKLGVDISSSPMTPQIKRCRGAALRALGKPLWPEYYHLLEPSSVTMLQRLYHIGNNGQKPIDLYLHFQQVVYDLILHLTYGARMGDVDDAFGKELLESVQTLTQIRSSTADFSHYVPLLRLLPRGQTKVEKTERRRRVQLDQLYNQYLKKVEKGEVVNCIVSSLGKDKLSLDEIRGTCVSLLQAAPETVASGMYQAAGWLSTPEGQKYQPVALKAILDYYGGDRDMAWDMAFREEKIPEIVAVYKETLRCWAPTPFAQGRATTKDIDYNGVHIPKGISIIMNGQGANLDPAYYGPDAGVFKPTRFMGDDSSLPHLAFGAGSRQCPAMNISNRMMYGLLIRTLLAFELKETTGPDARKPHLDMRNFSDYYGLVNVPRGWDCLLVARDPEWLLNRPTESKKAVV